VFGSGQLHQAPLDFDADPSSKGQLASTYVGCIGNISLTLLLGSLAPD